MRPTIAFIATALAIAVLPAGSIATAQPRHDGGAHPAVAGKVGGAPLGDNRAASTDPTSATSATKSPANALASHGPDRDKTQRKPARVPDEEEVMQAEH